MANHILGVQGSMWTHIAVTEMIDYQIYPRLVALAEVAWTPQQVRGGSDFDTRLSAHYWRLQLLDITYFDVDATGNKLGAWQGSDLAGDTPQQFEWDATPFLASPGKVEVQVRYDKDGNPTRLLSVALLEDGKEISPASFGAPPRKSIDVEVAWLALDQRKASAHYTVRVTLQGQIKVAGRAVCGS